eukprot:TRINITY_DN7928_c0_g1_i1.p1 TRINITY_DN7928_c0_g1~~TRINITY_DN7928_c0_g1_i1.p1  ORF type:complete len:262 (+),score=116.22 TRINITY_DN7928_c0_g1_i1:46-831(+)
MDGTNEKLELKLKDLERRENELKELERKMKERSDNAKSTITLNVGGKLFTTSKENLLRVKNTYFSSLLQSENWKPDEDGNYFIDRDPKPFSIILKYLRTGHFNLKNLTNDQLDDLQEELDYYSIDLPEDSDPILKLKLDNVMQSGTKKWAQDGSLPNVSGKILAKVLEYCRYHIEFPSQSDGISPWDAEFCNVDQPTLFELIIAAQHLEIQPLVDLACKTVANKIKGKTPEQMRTFLGVTSDFTPEEEEQLRRENEWVEER